MENSLRKALIGITPLMFSLVACSQTASKPAAPAASSATPTTAGAPQQAGTPSAPALAPPANPITDAQVRELMELTGTDKIKEQLTEYIMRNIQQAPFMPKDVIDDMHTSLDKTDVNTAAAATYKKYLSTDDAATIIAFYKTPAGKDLVKATPQIMGEVQRNAMQTGQTVARAVIERHRAEIEAAQKAYQAEHAPPSLGAPTPGAPKPGVKAPGSSATPAPVAPATTPKPTTPQG
jgi:hypothetical protein